MVQPKTQHGLCYAKNRVLHQHMFRQSDLLTQINSYRNMYKDMLLSISLYTSLDRFFRKTTAQPQTAIAEPLMNA